MDVHIHQAGHHDTIGGVNDLPAGLGDRFGFAGTGDPVAHHNHLSRIVASVFPIHSQDEAILNQQVNHGKLSQIISSSRRLR